MRLADELIALFPDETEENQRYIVWELESAAAAFDGEEVARFVDAATRSETATVRAQAHVSHARIRAVTLRRRHALHAYTGSVFTEQALARPGGLGVPRPKRPPAAGGGAGADATSRGLAWLEPVVNAAAALLDHGDPAVRDRAARAIAAFPTAHARSLLSARTGRSFAELLACARTGAVARVVAALEESFEGERALLAAWLPAPDHARLVARIVASREPAAWRHLAVAAVMRGAGPSDPAVAALLARSDAWVDVFLTRALARAGGAAALAALREMIARQRAPFVRAQAMRAAAATHADGAVEICLTALKTSDVRLQAQALESLLALGLRGPELTALARPLLSSPSVRVRVNAMLVDGVEGNPLPDRPLYELFTDRVAANRAQAAYALGFQSDDRSRALLELIVRSETVPFVARQAVKSLAKHPAAGAADALLEAIRTRTDGVDAAAALALRRYSGPAAAELSARVVATLRAGCGARARSLLLLALGDLGAADADAGTCIAAALTDPDPLVARAAARASLARQLCGRSRAPAEALVLAASGGDAAAPAAAGLILDGDARGLAALAGALATSDPRRARRALEVVEELAIAIAEGIAQVPVPDATQVPAPDLWPSPAVAIAEDPPPLDAPLAPAVAPAKVEIPEALERVSSTEAAPGARLRMETYRLAPPAPGIRAPLPAVALAALLLVAGALAVRPRPVDAPPPKPGAAAVVALALSGAVRREPAGQPLAPGWPVEVGESLRLEDDASASLMGPGGARLDAGPGSRLAFIAADSRSLDIRVDAGHVRLDLGAGATVRLSGPSGRLEAKGPGSWTWP